MSVYERGHEPFFWNLCALTAWNNDPDEVHEEIVNPEIIRFWSAITKTLMIEVEHACGVVEDVSVDLA